MNKLNDQTSPYLLQHADNPVAWYPWGPEALERAHREDKPILLSIGYSACHWCHVMAHESFEDADTAALMNELYVNIKVDREERPDLDKIYQTAHHLLTRKQGGWPLTMFLAADDHIPFFGGTYFPREARHGLPGFKDVLVRVAAAYREHDGEIHEYKAEMSKALAQTIADDTPPTTEFNPQLIAQACTQFGESFDEEQGGFGGAPKFPHPSGLELLLVAHAGGIGGSESDNWFRMVDRTLAAMARGGIYDHLGGGFCRYSVDASWTIPHFEKMLYDNGPLLSLYAQAWAVTQAPFYRSVAAATADWGLREMQSPQGGFYSSLDADSEGEEGRFYVWSLDEVREVVGEDYGAFAARYGLDGPPNFEGRWHLRLPALATGESPPAAAAPIERAQRLLLECREQRTRPGLDDKILAAWNALMIKGLATAGRLLQRDEYVQAAARSVAYLKSVHWRDERLLATSKDGVAHLNAYLDDYAYLIDALLALLQSRWDDGDLAFALALADVLLEQFEDTEHGGFFFTSSDHEKLIQRSKTFTDDAMASGNAVAALALFKLAHLVGETRYHAAAERTLHAALGSMTRWPSAHAAMMRALLEYADPPLVVVLRGSDALAMQRWCERARRGALIRGSCYAIATDAGPLPGILDDRVIHDGVAVTAYLCRGHACSAPVTTLEEFEELLTVAG